MISRWRENLNNFEDRKIYFIVFGLIVLGIFGRSLFLVDVRQMYITPDEFVYIDFAKSIAQNGTLSLHNMAPLVKQFLYALVMTPCMFIDNEYTRIFMIGMLNVVLLCTSAIPIFIIGKKIFKRNEYPLLMVIFVLLLPDMTMNMTFMSENLFFPICCWLFLFVFMFFDSPTAGKKVVWGVVSGITCVLAIFTKIAAVYFPLAIIAAIIFELLFDKEKKRKSGLLGALSFVFSFLLFYLFFDKIIIQGLFNYNNNLYSSMLIPINGENIGDLLYTIVYNMVNGCLAFLFFPVILPLFGFAKLTGTLKKFAAFIYVAFCGAVVEISYTLGLGTNEIEYGLRQEHRYYSALFIGFIILALYLCVEQGMQLETKRKKVIFVLTVMACTIVFLVVYKVPFFNECIDSVLVHYLFYLKFRLGRNPALHLPVKLLIIAVIILFTIIWMKKRDWVLKIFIPLVFVVSLVNNYTAVVTFRHVYQYGNEGLKPQINDISLIDDYFKTNSGEMLAVIQHSINDFDRILETYLLKDAYYIYDESIKAYKSQKDQINLSTDKMQCIYPSHMLYQDMNEVDYILTKEPMILSGDTVEAVQIEGLSEYHLYKNLTPDILGFDLLDSRFIQCSPDEKALIDGLRMVDEAPYFSIEQPQVVDDKLTFDNHSIEVSIKGWAADQLAVKRAGDIVIRIGDSYYRPKRIERPDLISVNPEYVEAGFWFNIPTELLLNSDGQVEFIIVSDDMTYKYKSVYLGFNII